MYIADFRPDGTWTFSYGASKSNLTEGSSGKYSTTEDTVTFEADAYCEAQHYGIEPGTYTWTFENEQLTLTPQHEPCVERRAAIGGVVFTRVSSTQTPTTPSG